MYIKKSSTIWQKDLNTIIKDLSLSCDYTTLTEAIHEPEYHHYAARCHLLLKKINYK